MAPSMATSSANNLKENEMNKSRHDLPAELVIFEILARLPVKSLFRFKSVCKEWNDLISHNSDLGECHSRKGPNATNFTGSSFFCRNREYVVSSDALNHQFYLSRPTFCHSSVCSSSSGLFYGMRSMFTEVFICNPITKHVTYIPTRNRKCLLCIALAYDPYNNPDSGFAIVALVRVEDDDNWFTFEVYSSKTREWRKSNAKVEAYSYKLLIDLHPVFSRGKVYWSVMWNVLWYDVEKDVAGLVPCPHRDFVFVDPFKEPHFQDIGVCNGNAGELSYNMLTKEGNIEIWLLRGDEQNKFEWERRNNVRLLEIFQQNWSIIERYFNPMDIWDRNEFVTSLVRRIFPAPYVGGEVVWFVIRSNDHDVVCSINMRTQELKVIHEDLPLPLDPFIPTFLSCPT